MAHSVDTSKRCTQQPAPKTAITKSQAAKASKANQELVLKTQGWKKVLADYAVTRKEIEDEIKGVKEEKDGMPKTSKDAFPTFGLGDMCPNVDVTDVNIGISCGTYVNDFAAANNMAGLAATPPECTWHHHQDFGRLQLVKKSSHNTESHTGGLAIWRRTLDPSVKNRWFKDTPLCCP